MLMIETPHITNSTASQAAVIRLTIPRSEIQSAMGPAIEEVMAAVTAQHVGPIGPCFSHHLSMSPDTFDMEVGFPVSAAVAPAGRVKPGSLPAVRVARTVYQGPYEGLGDGWGEFMRWIEAEGLSAAPDLWEVYVKGPESGADPAAWRTELIRPLAA
jgi:effector-binding domain-containing protein